MNSNLFHNIANVVIALCAVGDAALVAFGCTSLPNAGYECSQAIVSPGILSAVAGGLAVLKSIVNVVRDGFSGLAKTQPPVK